MSVIENHFTLQVCPLGFFPCKAGQITCIESSFTCDCTGDCSDGSDELSTWALCSNHADCQSGAEGRSPSYLNVSRHTQASVHNILHHVWTSGNSIVISHGPFLGGAPIFSVVNKFNLFLSLVYFCVY